MAKEVKKPVSIKEADLKEWAGEIEIDLAAPKVEVEAPQQKLPEPAAIQLSFNAWFQKLCTRNPKVKLSYRESIETHFKTLGLSLNASEAEYNEALKHFGIL